MNKLIFRKLFYDILSFFLISSICITVIIWVVQAVNYLDIVSEDGYGLKTYFAFTFLSLPKIFSRTIIFVFFISIFYTINKYDNTNEIIVFWNNGVKKITFINFIFRFSILFIIIQVILNLFIVPSSQNLGRSYLKNSNIDFLTKLISEKKFIDAADNLTIFVEKYNEDESFEKIYINEIINERSSKIITAQNGNFLKRNNKYFFKLNNGGITNIEDDNVYIINFLNTEYDLSKFSSKTVTQQKIQEASSISLYDCMKILYIEGSVDKWINDTCNDKSGKQVKQESFKRIIIPFYILIIALIGSSLIIKPKNFNFEKYYKILTFVFGVIVIILSQISIKFIGKNISSDIFFSIMPFICIFLYYLSIFITGKFSLKNL
tara:strand:- start:1227 stop:2357 length:1131 start_codon:yes stop_codon:yes gene_type:complete